MAPGYPRTGRAGSTRRLLEILLVVSAMLTFYGTSAEETPDSVRPAAKAGAWYSADPGQLASGLDALLERAPAPPQDETSVIRALIVPHAAYRFSGSTAAAAYRWVQGRDYRRVVLLGPAHRASTLRGVSILETGAYATPLGRIPLDRAAVSRLRGRPLVHELPDVHADEHSLEMQLPFLQRVLQPGWKLVPVLVGELREGDYPALADVLGPLLDDGTLLVVSSDFTHYGPAFGYLPFPQDRRVAERLRELDMGAVERMIPDEPAPFLAYCRRTGITACGYRAIALFLHLLPPESHIQLVDYATSGEMTGDYTNSVSYVAAVATEERSGDAAQGTERETLSGADLEYLHTLAEEVIRASVLRHPALWHSLRQTVASVPAAMRREGAAFVTLWRNRKLRGCVGTVIAHEPLFRSVMRNARSAALDDTRFPPVSPGELPALEVEISVLSPLRPLSSPDQCVAGQHGISLGRDGQHAVYLPEVPIRMGWDCNETLRQLSIKAGLPEDAWRNGANLKVFDVQKYPPSNQKPQTRAADAPIVKTPPQRGLPWPDLQPEAIASPPS
jgi:AmmeMemoRadiSam system protein B/AmmeMemoRadiSam system protein A